MSPELMFVAIAALLWGPTVVWLVIRSMRGQSRRSGETGFASPAASQGVTSRSRSGAGELQELVDSRGYWACHGCHSLNRPGASRCYGCKESRGSGQTTRPSPSPLPAMVPVMADGLEKHSEPAAVTAPAGPEVQPEPAGTRQAAAGSSAAEVVQAPADWVPVMSAATVAAALHPASDVESGSVPVQAASDPHLVCPFLRLKDDPATFFSFPEPANLCHADDPDEGQGRRGVRRLVRARPFAGDPQAVGLSQQAAICLTPKHLGCVLYIAGASRRSPPAVSVDERPAPETEAGGTPADPVHTASR